MSGPTVGATWVDRGTTAASKAARAMWMDVHHGELARCVETAIAAVAPIIAKAERERCAKVADGIVSEYQEQISDAIESGLRSIEADGLRRRRAAERVAAAIRALGDAT